MGVAIGVRKMAVIMYYCRCRIKNQIKNHLHQYKKEGEVGRRKDEIKNHLHQYMYKKEGEVGRRKDGVYNVVLRKV